MKQILLITGLVLSLIIIGCGEDPVTPVENSAKTLYVLNGSAETISKINMEDSSVVKDLVTTGTIPNRIRIYDERLYIVSSGDANIKVVDPKDDTKILQTIGLNAGDNPWDIAFASTSKAYVSNYNSNNVAIIDLTTGTVSKRIDVGQAPEGIIYKSGKIYVSNTGYSGWGQPFAQSSVSVIDVSMDKVVATINTPVNAQDLAFAPDGKLHVVCTGDYANTFGKVAIIDVTSFSLVDSVVIGGTPGDIEITNDGTGYLVSWGDGTNGFVYSYNSTTKTVNNDSNNPIKIGPNLSQLTYDEKENAMWIPYMTVWGGDGFVQKFDVSTNSVTWVSSVVGNGSSAVAVYEYTK